MAVLFDTGIFSVIGLASELLVGAKLYWYEAGTSTPLTTYSDDGLTIANQNPVLADASGRFPSIWLQPEDYKFILKRSDDVELVTREPIKGADVADVLGLSSGAGLVGYSLTADYPDGSVGKRLQNDIWFSDFDPVAYGGSTPNATAMANAIAEVVARQGGTINFGAGIHEFSDEIVINSSFPVNLRGVAGVRTIFRTTSATANLLTHNADDSIVEGIRFTAVPVKTAGYLFGHNGDNSIIQRCWFDADFIGIKATGVACKIIRNVFANAAPGARRIWDTGGDTSKTIANNLMHFQTPQVAECGIFIDNTAATKILNNDIVGQGRGLYMQPGTGQSISSVYSSGNFFDTCEIGGIVVSGTGTGEVRRCKSTGDWASSSTVNGISFDPDPTASVDGFDIIDVEAHMNGINGITIASETATNIRVKRGSARGNTNSAFSTSTNCQKFFVDGLDCKSADGLAANAYGIFIGAGCDNYRLTGNDVSGQTTDNINGHTPSATKIAYDNVGFVTENNGTGVLGSGATSIAISHGLAVTPRPKDIQITPNAGTASNPIFLNTGSITSTQFSVTTVNPAAGPIDFTWQAMVRN